MDGWIVGEFRVEGGGEVEPGFDHDGIVTVGGADGDSLSDAGDAGGSDEDAGEADGAVELDVEGGDEGVDL